MEFWLPYGTTEVPVRVPDQNFQRIIEPLEKKEASPDVLGLVEGALDRPLGDVALRSFVKQGSVVGVLVDPMIAESVLDATLGAIRTRLGALGVSEMKVYARTRSTVSSKFRMVNPSDGSFAELGRTSRGTRVSIDQDFLGCDFKLLIGQVQPHYASGFTGGPDLILPGASALETITSNRALAVPNIPPISSDYMENPVFSDSMEAASMIGSSYLLDLVPDEAGGGIAAAFSGALEPTFKESISYFQRLHSAPVDNRPEIIVVSSDSSYSGDLYHAARVLPFLSGIIKKSASTIVLAAECKNGVGDADFMALSKELEDRRSLQSELKRRFKLGGNVALVLKEALEKSRIQLVSVLPDAYCRSFGLKPSRTVSAGVQSAIRAEGKDARILIVPHGSLTIPTVSSSLPSDQA